MLKMFYFLEATDSIVVMNKTTFNNLNSAVVDSTILKYVFGCNVDMY